MFSTIVFIILLEGAVHGVPQWYPFYSGKIVAGQNTYISNHPWQVSFQLNDIHICGGSLISNLTVLTAAHCLQYGKDPQFLSIRAGSANPYSAGQKIKVSSVIIHPGWTNRGDFDNDVALIHLSSSPTVANVGTIQLPARDITIPDRAGITVTGWGFTREGGPAAAEFLQEVTVPHVELSRCAILYAAFRSTVPITSRMLCAGDERVGGRGFCQGDSGGPGVYDGQLVGVVSFAAGCARRRYPGVFARVSEFVDWIDENTI